MIGDYTMDTYERTVDSFFECEAAEVWERLFPQTERPSAKQWRAELESIAKDYRLSSRYVLMRILHKRIYDSCKAEKKYFYSSTSTPSKWPDAFCASENAFKVNVKGKWILFSDVSMEHAYNLSPEEHLDYLSYLCEIASSASDSEPGNAEKLILRAWHSINSANLVSERKIPPAILSDSVKLEKHRKRFQNSNKKKYGKRLTREEALKLGHVLGFSLNEMKCFLMRVFLVEDSFRLNQLEDLVEVYCFLLKKSWKDAKQLKDKCAIMCGPFQKGDLLDRNQDWTAQVEAGILTQIEEWARHDNCDELFCEWIAKHMYGLDATSYTARRLYRNLAIYAFKLAKGNAYISDESEIQDRILEVCNKEYDDTEIRYYLYGSNKEISAERCGELADALLSENQMRSESPMADRAHSWAVLTVLPDGNLSRRPGLVNSCRTRVQDILLGLSQAEKGDFLYLIWFLCSIAWYSVDDPDDNALCCRVLDLRDAADTVLSKANLPAFYAPHLMEQSMLLSALYGGKNHINPAEVYASMLISIKAPKKPKD